MKQFATSALIASICWGGTAHSFDIHTHVAITAKAVEKSAIGAGSAPNAVISCE